MWIGRKTRWKTLSRETTHSMWAQMTITVLTGSPRSSADIRRPCRMGTTSNRNLLCRAAKEQAGRIMVWAGIGCVVGRRERRYSRTKQFVAATERHERATLLAMTRRRPRTFGLFKACQRQSATRFRFQTIPQQFVSNFIHCVTFPSSRGCRCLWTINCIPRFGFWLMGFEPILEGSALLSQWHRLCLSHVREQPMPIVLIRTLSRHSTHRAAFPVSIASFRSKHATAL